MGPDLSLVHISPSSSMRLSPVQTAGTAARHQSIKRFPANMPRFRPRTNSTHPMAMSAITAVGLTRYPMAVHNPMATPYNALCVFFLLCFRHT